MGRRGESAIETPEPGALLADAVYQLLVIAPALRLRFESGLP